MVYYIKSTGPDGYENLEKGCLKYKKTKSRPQHGFINGRAKTLCKSYKNESLPGTYPAGTNTGL